MLYLRTLGALTLSGPSGDLLLRRRNDLAVLAVLADRAPSPVRRETVQALFWGERAEDKARHSLRQVVLQLRRACGDAFEADAATLRLTPGSLQCDAREFAVAATGARYRDAVDLWKGDFLTGCEDIGAEGFRAWLDVERERLHRLLALSCEMTVADLEASDDVDAAADYARRWTEHFPLSEAAHLRLTEILCRAGRGADADVVRSTFVRRLGAEMGDEPGDEWLAATAEMVSRAREADTVRSRGRAERNAGTLADAPVAAASPVVQVSQDQSAHIARRRVVRTIAFVAAASVLVALAASMRMNRGVDQQVLAVGDITSAIPADSLRGFGTLLTITLARIPGLDLISERRMSEVSVDMRSDDLASVARAAGATEVIEGVLARRPDGSLRADLRRTNLRTGRSRAAYTVEAADPTELADLLTEQVARDLKVPVPVARSEGTTTSIIAYRFYEQGLRAYHARDIGAARRFFAAALAEDSTFAMAALGAASVMDSSDAYMARAVRYAKRTNDRERLLIAITWGQRMADPRVLHWADTLVTRYPSDPESQLVYARQLAAGANPLEALAPFRRVVAIDSVTGRAPGGRCRACDALDGMMGVYRRVDSLAAAERLARTWLRWQPQSTPAWIAYSQVLGEGDRLAEAHAAVDSAMKYSPASDAYVTHELWWFRANDYASVDRAWRYAEQSQAPSRRLDGIWTHVIASRTQGRWRDALAAAREYRRVRMKEGDTGAGLLEAIVLAESGHPRQAALIFDSLAIASTAPFASRRAASRAWAWTHAAGAYALVRDTAALRRLEDSVRVNGALATDRFKRLHHYVRGLRLSLQHRPAGAADAFRNAVWSSQETHVRIYLELGRSLMDAGRPAEAIEPLTEALRGPVSASGLYATRTELQEMLALAYEKAGQRDNALAQYTLVSQAWRNADPQLSPRRIAVEARIALLSRSRTAP